MQIKTLPLTALLALLGVSVLNAGFIVSIDDADLMFDGAGEHTVGVLLTHDGTGESTLSGYTFRFGSSENASLGTLPAGVNATAATEGDANVSGGPPFGLFNFAEANNQVAAQNLAANADIGVGGSAKLFDLTLVLGNERSYEIGVDFVDATRGASLPIPNVDVINDEFFSPDSATTDLTFTLSNVSAVPEPSSVLAIAVLGGVAAYRRRKQRN